MGKLHTLRRAIERDPGRWIRHRRALGWSPIVYAAGRLPNGEWYPKTGFWSFGERSYRDFVQHVVEAELGIADSETGRGGRSD